jgi:hypothetical protein
MLQQVFFPVQGVHRELERAPCFDLLCRGNLPKLPESIQDALGSAAKGVKLRGFLD